MLKTAELRYFAKKYGISGYSDITRQELWNNLNNNTTFVWEVLEDNMYFTRQELELITCINGYNIETLNDCIYARYGYRDLQQMTDSEKNELDIVLNMEW